MRIEFARLILVFDGCGRRGSIAPMRRPSTLLSWEWRDAIPISHYILLDAWVGGGESEGATC